MKTPQVILASVLLSVVANILIQETLLPRNKEAPDAEAVTPGLDGEAAKMEERVRTTEEQILALNRKLAAIEIKAAQRIRVRETAKPVNAQALPSATNKQDGPAKRSMRQILVDLRDPNVAGSAKQALWDAIKKNGDIDKYIKAFEAEAKLNPTSVEVQFDLAQAYIQQITSMPDGPSKGVVGNKANQAYDSVLKLDDQHWEARFNKAISLSFWPPFLGKMPEAIQNLEILVGQQEQRKAEASYVQTYVILGNLLYQSGKEKEARAMWERGLRAFPDDKSLRNKLSRK